jgi:hypothetical protein
MLSEEKEPYFVWALHEFNYEQGISWSFPSATGRDQLDIHYSDGTTKSFDWYYIIKLIRSLYQIRFSFRCRSDPPDTRRGAPDWLRDGGRKSQAKHQLYWLIRQPDWKFIPYEFMPYLI